MNFKFISGPFYKKAPVVWLALLLVLQLLIPTALAAETSPAPVSGQSTTVTPAVTPRPSTQPTTPPRSRTATPSVTPGPTPTPGPKKVTRPPAVRASSALVVDADTGRILYAKNAHDERPMASTTKIMTALTLLTYYPTMADLQATTVIAQDDLVGEADMGLRQGETIKLSTLLLGLMTNSANEAGMAIARYVGQRLPGPSDPVDRFVAAMNTKALQLGMYETHFMNPHGLDQPQHYTSAYDLAIAGWYALRNPLLMQFARYLGGTVDGHTFYNVNSFLTRYPGATGIKPGMTDEAGRCWVASARNNGHNVIVTVLNSPNPPDDLDPLMDYAFTVLAGKADQPLSVINFGTLAVQGAIRADTPAAQAPTRIATPASTPVTQNPKALVAVIRNDLDYTLRLLASLFKV